jgi:hypothetical protein
VKVVYVAHPLGPDGPDREVNRKNASRWVGWLALHFEIAPIADWIILSGEWSETEENRKRGLAVDKRLVVRADEVWLVGGRISEGMKIESETARALGRPVVDLTFLGAVAPPSIEPDKVGRIVRAFEEARKPAAQSAITPTLLQPVTWGISGVGT